MHIIRNLTINAPENTIWRIIAEEYEHVGKWATAVQSSAINTDAKAVAGAHIGGRICETDLGPFKETIELFDATKKQLVYSATGEKMPFFVKSMRGHWQLKPLKNTTHVTMALKAELMFPFSVLMGWLMKIQMSKVIDQTLQELTRYAETGQVHQKKLRALAAV